MADFGAFANIRTRVSKIHVSPSLINLKFIKGFLRNSTWLLFIADLLFLWLKIHRLSMETTIRAVFGKAFDV